MPSNLLEILIIYTNSSFSDYIWAVIKVKILYFSLSVFLVAQLFCVVTRKYFWPLTPLDMFAENEWPEISKKRLFFFDGKAEPIDNSVDVMIPFGRFRSYFFQKYFLTERNGTPRQFLEIHTERIKVFRQISPRLNEVAEICFAVVKEDKSQCLQVDR